MRRPVPIARALGLIGALVMAAWFVLGSVQSRDLDRATTLITGGAAPNATQAREASSLLDSAATLNPDQQVQLLRSQLAFERGDRAQAVRLADAATRQEPQSVQAWVQLISVSTGPKVPGEVHRLGELIPNVPAAP
jgi:hypothetical protein